MAEGSNKKVRIHNKSDKPDNVVENEYKVETDCKNIEAEMPRFLRGFFSYLKGNVLPMTRLAYLQDIRFFFQYLINDTDLTQAENTEKKPAKPIRLWLFAAAGFALAALAFFILRR